MGDPFLFLEDDADDDFEDGGVVSSSTMTMGRFGPPVEGNGDGGVSPANVEKEVSGVGLSGRVIVG